MFPRWERNAFGARHFPSRFSVLGAIFPVFPVALAAAQAAKAPSREAGSAQNETKARGHHGSVQGKTTIHGCSRATEAEAEGGVLCGDKGGPSRTPAPPLPDSRDVSHKKKQQPRVQASPFSLSLGFDDASHVCFEADHCLSIHSFDSSSTSRSCGARSSPTCCVFCCA